MLETFWSVDTSEKEVKEPHTFFKCIGNYVCQSYCKGWVVEGNTSENKNDHLEIGKLFYKTNQGEFELI